MEKMPTILLLCLLTLCLIGCKSNEFIEIKDENGNLIEKYEANKEKQKDGVAYTYFGDGSLQSEQNYHKGVLDGERKIYFKNGQVEIIELYDKGIIHGPYRVFYENGQANIEVDYTQGAMQGLLKRFYESGALMEEVVMVDNEENGPFKEYYENGQVQWNGQYLNGENEFGLLEQFDEKGTLVKKMMCDSFAVCQTIWTIELGDVVPEKIKITHEKK